MAAEDAHSRATIHGGRLRDDSQLPVEQSKQKQTQARAQRAHAQVDQQVASGLHNPTIGVQHEGITGRLLPHVSSMAHGAQSQVAQPTDACTDSESSSDAEECGDEDTAEISARACQFTTPASEQDEWMHCARRIAMLLRSRPTLPASWEDTSKSFTQVEAAVRLPLYSCPFKRCVFATNNGDEFLQHLASEAPTSPPFHKLKAICEQHRHVARPLDFIYLALATIEREQVPLIGMATTRRALRELTTRYNDTEVQALTCFVCGCIHTTTNGPEHPFHKKQDGSPARRRAIHFYRGVGSKR